MANTASASLGHARQHAAAAPCRANFDELPRQGRLALVAGKVSRAFARNITTKTAVMRNAAPLVTFCFDDFVASACANGAPVLEQCGARGTYFVSAGGFGLSGPCGEIGRPEQVRELSQRGHEIGCHTFSHLAVSRVNRQRLADDLLLNRRAFAGIGVTAQNFCYPYCDLSFGAKQVLQREFDSCRAGIPGINQRTIDLGAIKAHELSDRNLGRAGVAALVARTIDANGWLVFYSHDVTDQPSRFGATPDLLRFAAETATAAGCRCVTIADGLLHIAGQQAIGSAP